MSCGQCFECDNCVVYCPQTAVARVPKKEATTGRYVYTDYDKCIGCHICKDVCPTGLHPDGAGRVATMRAWPTDPATGAGGRPRCFAVALARGGRVARGARDAPGAVARAAAGDRGGRRASVRRGHRVHAPQPHGAAQAPARPDGARGHPHDAAQPRQLRHLPRRARRPAASPAARTRSARAATATPGASSTASNATPTSPPRRAARGRERAGKPMSGRITAAGSSSWERRRWPASRSRRASRCSTSRRAARPPSRASATVRWGMLVDINRCAADCDACVTACDKENGLSGGKTVTDAQWIRKVELKDLRGRRALAADDVPALRRAALRRRLPDRRLVQARRRHRAGRPAHLHRLPLLHDGLPVRRALVRARAGHEPEAGRAARQGLRRIVHAVRAPHRPRPDPRVRRGLRRRRATRRSCSAISTTRRARSRSGSPRWPPRRCAPTCSLDTARALPGPLTFAAR